MGLFSNAKKQGIPGRDSVGGMGSAMARPAPPRPTLVQGGPAYFTPEGYRPPMQPQQAFMPTDTMGDPIGDMFRRQLPPVRGPSLPKMPPQRDPRDDFISIGGVGGKDGIDDPRMEPMPEPIDMTMPVPTPPEMGGGFGSAFDKLQEFIKNNPDKVNRGGGMLGKTDPQTPMPPMAPPMMPPVDIDRPIIRGLEDREIMNDFMSIERMDEPRDEFIPRMPNENPVPFIPPVEMPRDMPPIMPPSFERIEEDPRVPLEEPIAMPRNPEMVADIQRRMALPPVQSVTTPQPFLQEPQDPKTGGIPAIGGETLDNPIDTKLPEPPMAPPRDIAPPREILREMPREAPIQAPTPPAQIEQIKQVLPQLPPKQLMDIIPQLPPEVIQELPKELIRQIMPMMPEPMMPEPMQPRMQMPGPIATPTPRLQRPSLPMMPMMGGRGRR